jgi:transcription termination factor Rho
MRQRSRNRRRGGRNRNPDQGGGQPGNSNRGQSSGNSSQGQSSGNSSQGGQRQGGNGQGSQGQGGNSGGSQGQGGQGQGQGQRSSGQRGRRGGRRGGRNRNRNPQQGGGEPGNSIHSNPQGGNSGGSQGQGGQGQGQRRGGRRGGRDRNRGGSGGGGGQRDRTITIKRSEAEVQFLNKTPITPDEWISFEKGSSDPAMRAIDLLCPVGKGQRGLIVSPPKVGKTTILKEICRSVEAAYPKMKVYVLLVDERPEEVTDFRRAVKAEVFASSSDKTFRDHMRTADEVYQRAVADAAAGQDAMIVLDSLTRLARAHNTAASGRKTLSGGLDSRAMEVPRRFFGAARKLEEGGSLTILATILVDTNSRMDEVIFQEFKGTGNMELVLYRPAAEQRVYPAIHVKNSGTRREELLIGEKDLEKVWALRRKLATMGDLEGTKTVVELLRRNKTNEKVLATITGGM